MSELREDCPKCGDTRQRLYLRETSKGTLYYCHNCQNKGIKARDGTRTISETLEYLSKVRTSEDEQTNFMKELKLPRDFSLDIPTQARLWLYKYQITDEEIATFRFGWSEYQQRLILPVFDDDKLIYYQGRTFKPITKDNPKYLNVRQIGAKNVFFKRMLWSTNASTKELSSYDDVQKVREKSTLCVVEDILSAIKVGRVCNSLSLLGSYFPPELYPLYRPYNKILIWLDSDKYKEAIKQAYYISSVLGIESRVIYSDLDPKEYTTEDIKKYIEGKVMVGL